MDDGNLSLVQEIDDSILCFNSGRITTDDDDTSTADLVQDNTSGPFFNNGRGNPVRSYIYFEIPVTVDERYDIFTMVHKGLSTVLFSAVNTSTGEEVTIKKYQDVSHGNALTFAMREAQFASGLNHENLIEVENIFLPVISLSSDEKLIRSDFSDVYIVYKTKWLTNLNFHHNVEEKNVGDPKRILYEVLKALKYLHISAGVVHRDVKPQNILISQDRMEIRLRGFSRCMVIGENSSGVEDVVELEDKEWVCSADTRRLLKYSAPEILMGCLEFVSDPCTDIWAAGCLFAECLSLDQPFLMLNKDVTNPTPQNQVDLLLLVLEPKMEDFDFIQDQVQKREILRRYNALLEQEGSLTNEQPLTVAASLLNQLLSFDPNKRINVQQALEHPYFEDMAETVEAEDAERDGINAEEACYFTEEIEDDHNKVKEAIWEAMMQFND